MLPVAVEIAPPEAPREQVLVLLAACSRAVADSECALAADVGDGPTRAVAIVTWQSDSRVFVEVGMRRDGHSEWRSRSVLFGASDEPSERWKAVGFAVGTLARGDSTEPAQLERTPPPPVDSPTPPPTAAAKPKPKSVPPPRAQEKVSAASKPASKREQESESEHESVTLPRVRLAGGAIDVGASLGPGLDNVRYGGMARLQLPVLAGFQLIAGGEYLQYQNDPLGLSSSWLDLQAGVARSVRGEFWEFQLGVDGRAERLRIDVRDATRAQHHSIWQPGLGLFTSVTWLPIERLGFFISGGAAAFTRRTPVKITGAPIGVDEYVHFGVDAGLRLRLW